MERVDYTNTFIAVAPDSAATRGTPPPVKPENPSIAARTYQLIADHPYAHTSGDVLFTVFADRNGIAAEDRPSARAEFYSRSRACLRSPDLGKRYGWGIHADAEGRLALYGMESTEYAEFVSGQREGETGERVDVKKAMRGSR